MNESVGALLKIAPFIVALPALTIALKKGKINKDELGLNRPSSLSAFLFWILGFALFTVAAELFLYSQRLSDVQQWTYSIPAMLIRSLGILILAPLTEEILLRGLLLSKLRQRAPMIVAVLVQSLLFVVLHAITYDSSIQAKIGIAQIFIDGCLFAFARIQTRSVYTSIGMHMFGNFIALLQRIV